MGSKSEAKKQLIIDTASRLFSEQGFYNITMKDIVEACNISRGGLYLYYENTKQIFLEVLRQEQAKTVDPFAGKITPDTFAIDIVDMFLEEQKKEILKKTGSLSVATYEFFFRNKPEKDHQLRSTFEQGVKVLTELFKVSIENGEIIDVDPKTAATNIMLVIEGMKVMSNTIDLAPEIVDQQLEYVINLLLMPEE